MICQSKFNLTSHSFEDKGYFPVYFKDFQNFELNYASMRSAEYQKTFPPKFIIIIHNYANVWTIMQPIKITTQFSGSDVTGRH